MMRRARGGCWSVPLVALALAVVSSKWYLCSAFVIPSAAVISSLVPRGTTTSVVLLHSSAAKKKPSGGTTKASTAANTNNNNNNNKRPAKAAWSYTFLSPERREQVMQLTRELEEGHFMDNTFSFDNWDSAQTTKYIEQALDVLVQWARLGEGPAAERVCKELIQRVDAARPRSIPSSAQASPEEIRELVRPHDLSVKAYRRVLHAYCNHVTRISTDEKTGKRKRTKQRVRKANGPLAATLMANHVDADEEDMMERQEIAKKADRILQLMERSSHDYLRLATLKTTSSSVTTTSLETRKALKKTVPATLLDGSDYHAVILAYAQTNQVISALHALRRLEGLYSSSTTSASTAPLPRLAPTTAVYTAVIRAVLQGPANQWYERMGVQYSPVEMAHALGEGCMALYEASNKSIVTLAPTLVFYNTLLDGWSKALLPPPPLVPFHKRRIWEDDVEDDVASRTTKGSLATKKELVASKATGLWNAMNEQGLVDARSHVLMIYTYCKSGNVDDAYTIWEKLLDRLLAVKHNVPVLDQVDARSFRMLVHVLRQKISDTADHESATIHAERINSILEGMWKLHERGYEDTAPDVFLYTSAMNAWADTKGVTSVAQARALMSDLESRHDDLKWKNLRKDVAIYNALINTIANQPDQAAAAEEAGSVVKLMERDGVADPTVLPDTITYNTLIDACLASKSETGIARAEQTLLWMVEEFRSGNTRVKPILRSYSSVIRAWAECPAPGATARAEALLDRLEERYRPPASLYEILIHSWCKEADLVATTAVGTTTDVHPAQRAQRLLNRMEELFNATGSENEVLRPTMSLYNAVIKALQDSGESGNEAAELVRQHRNRMYPPLDSTLEPMRLTSNNEVFALLEQLDESPSLEPHPPGSVRNFNTVLSLLAKSGKIWAGQRAEDVLNYMLELHLKRGNRHMMPDIVTFNSVMSAWAKSSHPEAGKKAAAILGKLETLHNVGLLTEVTADRISYNTIMNAYARSAVPRSAEMAEEVFAELEALYEKDMDESLRPDIVSYTTVLNAWANSGERIGAQRAEEILMQMHENYKDDHTQVKPNTLCFNEVIYAWAKNPDKGASKRAEMVLNVMEDIHLAGNGDVRPDTRTYNVVLFALANSSEEDAPTRAQLLLDRMKEASKDGDVALKPDSMSYGTVISAWAKQGGAGTLKAIETILEELYASDIQPDAAFFSGVIHALTRTGAKGAPAMAEKIMKDVQTRTKEGKLHVELNTNIYNALINCWAKSGERDAAARAEEILQDMIDEYAQGNKEVQPNVQTYTSVIDAYAKSREPDTAKRAESILNRMEDNVRPNVQTYTAVIQNYARSDHPSKAARAQAILQRMKDDYSGGNNDAKPNVVAYNAVLNACEYSVGEEPDIEQAFKVACATLDELRSSEHLKPNHVTYGTFMGVIAELMPKSDMRSQMVELVFKRCCADGQMGPVVLKKLKDAASPSLYKKLLQGLKETKLPSQWSCNVIER